MSLKNSFTRSDYLEWHEGMGLIQKLERDRKYSFVLFIGCGMFLGMRISDLKSLCWADVLEKDKIELIEQKTGKKREIKINDELSSILKRTYSGQPVYNRIFPLSIQYYNRVLKKLKIEYRLKVDHFSSHSLRKTFGRRVWQMDGYSEKSLVLLCEIFNHSGTQITRKYLGIRQEEISSVYDLL